MTGSPKFLGDPNDPFAHVLRLRRDGWFQTVDAEASFFRTVAWPLLRERQRLSQRLKLSKLNHMALGLAVYASPQALPLSTQDSLLAVGQTLPDGIHTRRVTIKGFRFQFTSLSSPFAKLLGAIPFSCPQCQRWALQSPIQAVLASELIRRLLVINRHQLIRARF